MAGDHTTTIPARIAALEAMWGIRDPQGNFRARISALEMQVEGETSACSLLDRVVELEQHSG
jgi:hypothetical protein